MAHKKGQGSSRNGRDSNAQRLGVKAFAGQSVTDAMLDNFYEVMNICSKLLMSDTSSHLRLDKTMPPEESSEPIAALQGAASVTCFDVAIPKYGKGALTFVVS